MRQDYEKLFSYLNSPEPSDGLFEKIMHCLQQKHKLVIIKRRLIIFSLGLVGSIVALTPILKMVRTEFAESGFTQFFSLLFSDFGVVISSWQNFALSLLERLPITGLIILLTVLLVFLELLKLFIRDIRVIINPKQLLNSINN